MKKETAGILLHLNYLRSAFVVGMGLAVKCPTEEEWEAQINNPEFIQQLDDFADFLESLRVTTDGELTVEKAQTLGEQHTDTAQSKIVAIAENLDIPVEDLLTVVINS